MVEAVVEFDYQATEDDELSLVKGDVISNVVKMDGGWWQGTLKGKTGMFPDNFVKEVKKEKNKELSSSIKRGSAAQAAAGGHVAELANKLGKEGLKVGAGPTKRQDSKPGGAGGATENQQAAAAATPGSIPNRVRVAHSYTPKNEDELELIIGQIINVTNKEEEGWWEGTNTDGRMGVFPSNFVEEFKEEDDTGDGEFHAIQGKKVKGIGFGNIFAGGPVKLKGAKKQDSGDTEHAKPAPQEAKRKSHAPAVPSEPQNAAPKEKPAERAKVLFGYSAENEDELSIEEGQIVMVLEKELVDSGWWKGEINGRRGVFPDNFVELLPHEEPKPKRPSVPPASSAKPAKSSVQNKSAATGSPAKHKNNATAAATAEPRASHKTPAAGAGGGSGTGSAAAAAPTASRKPTMPPPLSKKPGKQQPADPKLIAQTDDHKAKEKTDLDAVETTERLSHPTANRVKAPVRRPPSQTKDAPEENHHQHNPRDSVDSPEVQEISTPRGGSKRLSRRAQPPPPPPPKVDDPAQEEEAEEEEPITAAEVEPPVRQPRPPPPVVNNEPAVIKENGGAGEMGGAVSAATNAEVESLREELAELRANSVSKLQYEQLQNELLEMKDAMEKWQSKHSKLLNDLMEEVDEEKKIRLATEVEMKRIKKMVQQ